MMRCAVCNRRFKMGEKRFPIFSPVDTGDEVLREAHLLCYMVIQQMKKLSELEEEFGRYQRRNEERVKMIMEDFINNNLKSDW